MSKPAPTQRGQQAFVVPIPTAVSGPDAMSIRVLPFFANLEFVRR